MTKGEQVKVVRWLVLISSFVLVINGRNYITAKQGTHISVCSLGLSVSSNTLFLSEHLLQEKFGFYLLTIPKHSHLYTSVFLTLEE